MSEIQLTPEQRAICRHDPKVHARILAGPGTGKSFSVVAMIEELVEKDASLRVRLLTFTRAATAELGEKVSDHPVGEVLQPSTIHSFALSVLAPNPGVGGLPEPLRLADDWEKRGVIYPTLSQLIGVQVRRLDRLFAELAAGWERLEETQDPKVDPEDRNRFLGGWQQHRQIFGYVLPSELPLALRRALLGHPDLGGVNWDVLVVDEYQDLNACDLEVLRLLANRGSVIIGVGDDDQSIYSFRWAHPAGIRRFPLDYQGAADYPLTVTHRCGSRVLAWAQHVITQDVSRGPGKPAPNPASGSPEGETALLSFRGERAEAKGIARIVRALIDREGVDPSQILVLLRGDYQGAFSKPIKEELERLRIECSDPDAVKRLFDESENRRFLALARLLACRSDSLAWATLLTLHPGVGATLMDYVYQRARLAHRTFGSEVLQALEDGFAEAPRGSGVRASDLVGRVCAWTQTVEVPASTPDVGWGHWLTAVAGGIDIVEPADQFQAVLHQVDALLESDTTLSRFLGQLLVVAQDQARAKSSGVRVMTMAQSKGLTVETAILAALEDDIIPHPNADRDEEARLMYVALTRAKRFVFGTWARRRGRQSARSGRGQARRPRTYSGLLEGGPVTTQEGDSFIASRWPAGQTD